MKLGFALCLFLFSGASIAQDWQDFDLDNGSLSCKDQVVLKSFMHDGFHRGVALVSLKTGEIKWEAILNEPTVMQPVVAGDVAAVVTPGSNTISAFAISTGQPLWQKESYTTQILDSDGRYFYILSDSSVVEAVDPKTGKATWSRKVPYSGYLISSYHVRSNRLYTGEFVLDVARRKVVHHWPLKPIVDAMAFDGSGRIYVGDPSGVIRIYSGSFKLQRMIRAGFGQIVELGTGDNGFLGVSYEYFHRIYHAVFKVLTPEGKTKWQVTAKSQGTLGGPEFMMAGQNVVLIEPEAGGDEYWLTCRDLVTGRINWRYRSSYPDYFVGPMAVCGDTLYVSDLAVIHEFDLRTGSEKLVSKRTE